MNVAITVWGDRISPVFDSARTLLVAKIQGGRVVESQLHPLQAAFFNRSLRLFDELGVCVLICGALCQASIRLLEYHGVEVIPFVTGNSEQILACFIMGKDLRQFVMPGCRYGRCWRGRRSSHQEPGMKDTGKVS